MITGSALFFAGFGLGLASGLGIALWVAKGAYGDLRAHLGRRSEGDGARRTSS